MSQGDLKVMPPAPGRQDNWNKRCLQAQASLVLLGLTLSNTFVSTLDLRLSSEFICLVQVFPATESTIPSSLGWNGRGSSWPMKLLAAVASSLRMFHEATSYTPSFNWD